MASVVLAVLVVQTKGVKFYDLGRSGASRGERVDLRRPDNVYDINCLDVRLLCGRLLLGHVEAPVVACLSPLMHDWLLDGTGSVYIKICI